jgi:hypothetical protein
VVGRHEPAGEKARRVSGIVVMLFRVSLEGIGSGGHFALTLSQIVFIRY